jgi:hypothetical protein
MFAPLVTAVPANDTNIQRNASAAAGANGGAYTLSGFVIDNRTEKITVNTKTFFIMFFILSTPSYVRRVFDAPSFLSAD